MISLPSVFYMATLRKKLENERRADAVYSDAYRGLGYRMLKVE